MVKAAKIDDVKRPGKTAPSPTSRPLLISSPSTPAGDPMLAEGGDKQEDAAVSMTHTARNIKPLTSAMKTEVVPDQTKPDEAPAPAEEPSVPENPDTKTATSRPTTQPDEPDERHEPAPATAIESIAAKAEANAARDPDAAVSAEDSAATEAKKQREQELEAIIAGGKYAVPINAVQRKRSRIATIFLSLLAVLLAVVLLDAVLDVGVVSAPAGVPHTHLFSK